MGSTLLPLSRERQRDGSSGVFGYYLVKALIAQIVKDTEPSQTKHLGATSFCASQYGRFPASQSLLYSNGLLPQTNMIIDTKNQAVPMIPKIMANVPPISSLTLKNSARLAPLIAALDFVAYGIFIVISP
jgi:hypothetical protein